MKVLVTGGAGFIGSHYARAMLAGNFQGFEQAAVTVLDTGGPSAYGALAPVSGHRRLTMVRGDIRDVGLLASFVPGHDFVVRFPAADTYIDKSTNSARELAAPGLTVGGLGLTTGGAAVGGVAAGGVAVGGGTVP